MYFVTIYWMTKITFEANSRVAPITIRTVSTDWARNWNQMMPTKLQYKKPFTAWIILFRWLRFILLLALLANMSEIFCQVRKLRFVGSKASFGLKVDFICFAWPVASLWRSATVTDCTERNSWWHWGYICCCTIAAYTLWGNFTQPYIQASGAIFGRSWKLL